MKLIQKRLWAYSSASSLINYAFFWLYIITFLTMDSSFRERAHRIFFQDAITLKTDTTTARFERHNRLDLESGQVANYGNIFSSFSFPPLCYFRIPRIFPIFALFCHKQRKYWLRGINCAKINWEPPSPVILRINVIRRNHRKANLRDIWYFTEYVRTKYLVKHSLFSWKFHHSRWCQTNQYLC